MDAITITRFILPVRVGCEPAERAQPQTIRIDLTIETDFTDVLATGDLTKGVDYGLIRRIVKEVAGSEEFVLLENLGDVILLTLFQNKRITGAKIAIRKLDRWKDAIPGIVMKRRKS